VNSTAGGPLSRHASINNGTHPTHRSHTRPLEHSVSLLGNSWIQISVGTTVNGGWDPSNMPAR
jgi:hypothetical protein